MRKRFDHLIQFARRHLRDQPAMRPIRLARLAREARSDGHMDWHNLVAAEGERWRQAVESARGPKVLLATNLGLNFGAGRIDSLLAAALTLRGARVSHLLCDAALPACMAADLSWYADLERFGREGSARDLCRHCFGPAVEALAPLGLPVHSVGSVLTDEDRRAVSRWASAADLERIGELSETGIALGEQALSGALRFFARGTLEPSSAPVVRAYLRAARLVQLSMERHLAREPRDTVVLHHGIYVPQGTAAAVAAQAGARVVTWNPAYRKRCFIFSHDDTYHRAMLTEPVETWQDLDLSPGQQIILTRYLESRWNGAEDWISFSRAPVFDFKAFAKERGIDPDKPAIAMLTNVFWDAQLHYPANAFRSMRDWLIGTVRYFAARPDLQLIIRVHPAEITGNLPAREAVADILAVDIGTLPPNVFVIGPAEKISTYAVAARCRAAIIYATKAGIELLTMGIPVVAAGEAWVRGKGMAVEAASEAGYYAILDRLPETDLDINMAKERARLYAYHFFFRRMIPLAAAEPVTGWPPYRLAVPSLAALEPGADPGLDVICDGILEGKPFIYPAERLET